MPTGPSSTGPRPRWRASSWARRCGRRTVLRGPSAADDAAWVVRRALVVSPYDEQLYRALLRATALQGNRLALRATMTQLLTLAGDVAVPRTGRGRRGNNPALTCVHPQTAALYRDLLRDAPAAGGVPSRL